MVFFVFRIGNHTNFSQYFQAISAAKHLKLAPFAVDPVFPSGFKLQIAEKFTLERLLPMMWRFNPLLALPGALMAGDGPFLVVDGEFLIVDGDIDLPANRPGRDGVCGRG